MKKTHPLVYIFIVCFVVWGGVIVLLGGITLDTPETVNITATNIEFERVVINNDQKTILVRFNLLENDGTFYRAENMLIEDSEYATFWSMTPDPAKTLGQNFKKRLYQAIAVKYPGTISD